MIVDNSYPDIRVEREARALVARGHHVDVICARLTDEPRREVIDGVHVHRVPVRRQRGKGLGRQLAEYVSFTFWAAAQLLRLQLRHRYDVVQAHNVPDFLVFAALPARLAGSRVILDLHDLMPEFYASRFGGEMRSLPVRVVRWQEQLAIAFADQVLTVTDLWRDSLIARGVPASKVHVVMNAPDADLFAPREPVLGGMPPLTVIYHGTLTHRYGIDLLVRAVDLARRRVPLRLLLHGRGEMVPEIEALIQELDMGDVVTLSTELVPTAELARTIATADIGVVPNRNDVFTDGILPTKLMEYAALGIPAIVARSSATSAYFSEEMVRYVDPGDVAGMADAIVELANDPECRLRLATSAQAIARRHPWRDEATRYTDVVESLASFHGDRRFR
jgi:glycosyltransferase involved in cell wall biosynthesis